MDDATARTQLERLVRLHGLSLAIHRELLRLDDEQTLFQRACELAVRVGEFRYAWLGRIDGRGAIVRLAEFGPEKGYADDIDVALDDSAKGRGPTGSAIREGRHDVCVDIEHDPRMAPWRSTAMRHGFRSSGAFPIARGGQAFGALNVYAAEPGFVDPREVELLDALAEDLGVALDRIDANRQRRVSEERYRTLVEFASDGIFLADQELRYLDANPAACAMLGYSREELTQLRVSDVIEARQLRERPVDLTPFQRGVPFFTERRLVRKDGKVIDVELHGVILDDGRLQSVARDVTERKRADAERVAMDRMASLGRLAQGIGHEINNPLAYTSLNLELAQVKLSGPWSDDARADLENAIVAAQEGTTRIATIVRTLSAFGRGESEKVGAAELSRVIEGAVTLTAHRIRHLAKIELELTPGLLVRANEFRLGQVFVNLMLNAADAIEEVPGEDHSVRVETRRDEDGTIVAEVTDTGPGIAEAALTRIFEPFFSTKPVGRGTGIGLSIAHEIVASFGGKLEASNVSGKGARFTVHLLAGEPRPPRVPPSHTEVRGDARLHVLVVDDETAVAATIRQVLADHEVTAVSNVEDALAACEGQEFDCVLCDLMLRGQSGEALYSALVARGAKLARRVAFMTGGAVTPSAVAFLARTDQPSIEKPFSAEALRALVRSTASCPG